MRKLELKDICGYLPYNLQVKYHDYKANVESLGVNYNVDGDMVLSLIDDCEYINYEFPYIEVVQPILRPMSDLVKPIIVKGYNDDKEFVPILEMVRIIAPNDYEEVKVIYENGELTKDNILPLSERKFGIEDFDLLNQWHFDYHGLIDAGLAIDINTIKQ